MKKIENATPASKSAFGFIMAPGTNKSPIAYSEDVWNNVESDTEIAETIGEGAGYFRLSDVNEIFADKINSKVDKVEGKGLSTNDYTIAEKNKLSGIADGAEVNVQADWNLTSSTADDYIKNKPGSLSFNDVALVNDSSNIPKLISGLFLDLLLSIAYFDTADALISELNRNCRVNVIFDISGFENLQYPIYFYDDTCVISYGSPSGGIAITCTYDVYYKIKNKQILQILLTDYLYNDYSFCFTCKTSFVKDVVSALGLVKGEDDLLYQIHPENGDVTPLSHPDLSTQPSILPQRFGKYDIKELVVPVIKYTQDVTISQKDHLIYDDTTVLSLKKDENFVNGNIIEISLFGNGYCTHPTVKLEDDTYKVYPMLPYEEMDKLEFALIRYMIWRDNYYYYANESSDPVFLITLGDKIIRYSNGPEINLHDNGYSESADLIGIPLYSEGYASQLGISHFITGNLENFYHYYGPFCLAIQTGQFDYKCKWVYDNGTLVDMIEYCQNNNILSVS